MDKIELIVIIFGAFLISNTMNTYFLTHKRFNRYIAPFKHHFKGELNAIIGNIGTLLIFLTTGILIFKNAYVISIYLIVITFIFNGVFFALSVFNLYYGNAFSKAGLDIFKNPSDGLFKGIILEVLRELVTYYRIILFIPTIGLVIIFNYFDHQFLKETNLDFEFRTYVIYVMITIVFLIFSYENYKKMFLKELPIQSTQSTFAIQTYGVYPYYIAHLVLPDFESDMYKLLKIKSEETLIYRVNRYNKNNLNYQNPIDGNKYCFNTPLKDVSNTIKIDPRLDTSKGLQGILKGKNLVLVQMESMNQFLLELSNFKEEMPFLNALLKESVVFNQFYTSVGIGVSSDAEVSVLTGLYPSGINNFYWRHFDHKTKQYKVKSPMTTLAKYFNRSNYQTKAFHGDQAKFYNRTHAYKSLIEFQSFDSLESFTDRILDKKIGTTQMYRYNYRDDLWHISPWISDYHLFKRVASSKDKKPFFYFPVTMMPHIPFEYHPKGEVSSITHISLLTRRYLAFRNYYDDIIKTLFLNDDGTQKDITNNVYLFYGDHGSGLKNNDLFKLFNVSMKDEPLFERKTLQQVVSFMYVPGLESKKDDFKIKEGLIKGTQDLVRGQIDIHRTIVELFGLDIQKDLIFGVNLLSKEPTFVLDNKLLDVATDHVFFSLRNPSQTYPNGKAVNKDLFKVIKETKILHDLLFKEAELQEKINKILNK